MGVDTVGFSWCLLTILVGVEGGKSCRESIGNLAY